MPCEDTSSVISSAPPIEDAYSTIPVTSSNESTSSSSQQPNYSVSIDSCSSNNTIILSCPEFRFCSWPKTFVVPHFSYCAQMMFQKRNDDFNANGSLLSLLPKVRTEILECLAEEIIKYAAFPRDEQYEEVAQALVQRHPYFA